MTAATTIMPVTPAGAGLAAAPAMGGGMVAPIAGFDALLASLLGSTAEAIAGTKTAAAASPDSASATPDALQMTLAMQGLLPPAQLQAPVTAAQPEAAQTGTAKQRSTFVDPPSPSAPVAPQTADTAAPKIDAPKTAGEAAMTASFTLPLDLATLDRAPATVLPDSPIPATPGKLSADAAPAAPLPTPNEIAARPTVPPPSANAAAGAAPLPEPLAGLRMDRLAAPATVIASTFETPVAQDVPADAPDVPQAPQILAAAQTLTPQRAPAPATKPSATAVADPNRPAAATDADGPTVPLTDAAATLKAQAAARDGGSDGQDDSAKDTDFALAAPPEAADSADGAPSFAQAATSAAAAVAGPSPRATVETVSRLATHIAEHAANKSTQFDITLEPLGLGKVDVQLRIAHDGALTAALAFDTPGTAAELRARAGELQQALQQAGFTLADGAISFDVAGQGGQGQRTAEQFDTWKERTQRAFAALEDTAWPASTASRPAGSGLDLVI